MLRVILVVALLLFGLPAARADTQSPAPPAWEPKKTFALLVGVLEWRDKGLATYPKAGRVDRALERALLAGGVPRDQVVFLEDRAATRAAIRHGLADVARRAGPGSTLVFYYAGHGLKEGGATYFANYDVATSRTAETAFGLAEIPAVLEKHWQGERLLLLADCCHSGALALVAERSARGGRVRAACVTSATASNESTGRWTFTEAVVGALSGSGEVDRDRDGAITFAEVDGFVHDEMRFRESQLTNAFRTEKFEAGFVLRPVDPARALPKEPAASGTTFRVRDYVECHADGAWHPAQIVGARAGALEVHLLDAGFGSDPRDGTDQTRTWVAPSRVRAPVPGEFKVGEELEVEWKKEWYAATVTKVVAGFAFVHYDGWGAEWDEWVPPARTRPRARK